MPPDQAEQVRGCAEACLTHAQAGIDGFEHKRKALCINLFKILP